MAQEDIIKLLEKYPKGLTRKQIETKLGFSCIRTQLMKLREYAEIKFIERLSKRPNAMEFVYFPKKE